MKNFTHSKLFSPRWNEYIIIQAGGKGSRMGYLTANRPKCLVPIENRPMIFHIFDQFPTSRFIIIGDTHYEVLEKYLKAFASVEYTLVRSTGCTGTLAGLAPALEYVPDGQPFMYIWSDLILPVNLKFPTDMGNYIGIGNGLACRWKFQDGVVSEEPSSSYGIAGLFLLQSRQVLGKLPREGQFVKYISKMADCFRPWYIDGLREFGLLEKFEGLPKPICRPFNRMEFSNSTVCKIPVNEQGNKLAEKEQHWYLQATNSNLPIPEILEFNPLKMERIKGMQLAQKEDLDYAGQQKILYQLSHLLQMLHSHGQTPFDYPSWQETYIDKTFARLYNISDLVPFADMPIIKINGLECRNPLFHKELLQKLVENYIPEKFVFIHGDSTFSNIMITEDGTLVLIDPRGYFGRTDLFGDKAYDYAKVFYSIFGNYDNFNKKLFRLRFLDSGVNFYIQSNGWESQINTFEKLLPSEICLKQIRLLHSIIWLSLTTYAWEDYDSICTAFYNGTMLFEESLNEHNL